jgi:hypothetical protein
VSDENLPERRSVPPDLLKLLALRVLHAEGGTIQTQSRLLEEVNDQLRGEDPAFRVGAVRLREILISDPRIRVEIRYATRRLPGPLTSCPVCRGPLRELRNRTLRGEVVVTGWKCTRCPYRTPLRRRVPARYVFHAVD